MRRAIGTTLFAAALLASLTVAAPAWSQEEEEAFTTDFRIEDCEFESEGRNDWFSLIPGDRLVLSGEDDEGTELVVQITVLQKKRTVRFILFTGEEQGLHGSREYVRVHKEDMPKTSVALVHDTGTGKVVGISTAGVAGLSIERVSYLASGRVVEFTRSLYRGDAYDFVAELTLSDT